MTVSLSEGHEVVVVLLAQSTQLEIGEPVAQALVVVENQFFVAEHDEVPSPEQHVVLLLQHRKV